MHTTQIKINFGIMTIMEIVTCTSEVSSGVDIMIDEATVSAAAYPRLGYDIVKLEQREVVTAFEIATCTCELDTMIDKAAAQFGYETL